MEIFLVRHAVAVPRARTDAARRLTPAGRREFTRVVRGLGRLGVEVDRLYHSPWTRAVETAELLRPLLDGECEVHPGLARSPNTALLAGLRGRRIALVGHEPWLGQFLGILIGGDPQLGRRFKFSKGCVAWLEGDPKPGGMLLRALLPPRVLRRLPRA